jgi:hypothetical protein
LVSFWRRDRYRQFVGALPVNDFIFLDWMQLVINIPVFFGQEKTSEKNNNKGQGPLQAPEAG